MKGLNKIICLIICLLTMFIMTLPLQAQEVIELYPDAIPNSRPVPNSEYRTAHELVDSLTYKVSVPTLKIFHGDPAGKSKTAVIICPGGGYGVLLTKREGSDVASQFAENGVTAIVLKYRLPDSTHESDTQYTTFQPFPDI